VHFWTFPVVASAQALFVQRRSKYTSDWAHQATTNCAKLSYPYRIGGLQDCPTGAFTLMAIIPVDLRIKLLIKNSALRLYRLPRASELLKRLVEGWPSHLPADLSLPCSPPRNCPTCPRLTTMAQLVPTHGPRLRTHAAPLEPQQLGRPTHPRHQSPTW
jgi:hypothetical protein